MTFLDSLAGLGSFALYFLLSLLFLFLFKVIYVFVTPHNEWQLIKEEQNTAAAIAFGGAVLGFAIALSGAATNSLGLLDYVMWAVVALLTQLLAFAFVRFVFMPKIVERIEKAEVSAGVMLGFVSIAVGVLNAACMSY